MEIFCFQKTSLIFVSHNSQIAIIIKAFSCCCCSGDEGGFHLFLIAINAFIIVVFVFLSLSPLKNLGKTFRY